MNSTHDPALRSWVESANAADTDFPIQNLPFGVFRGGRDEGRRVGVAIGDRILELRRALEAGALPGLPARTAAACAGDSLAPIMALPPAELSVLRRTLSAFLAAGAPASRVPRRDELLVPAADAALHVPVGIGDYTDFYASLHHALNVGRLFRPEHPLLPNYKWVPIGYHGRASSIVASGARIRRPAGQRRGGEGEAPSFGPTRQLDYEMELGAFIGMGNALGEPVPIAEAERRLFGVCLLNDWSARDIQSWEYQPLGPFLGKSFATTVSPWVVTMEALEPFRVPAAARSAGDPAPLPYLADAANDARGGIGVRLEVTLRTARMRERGAGAVRLGAADCGDLYWTLAQMVTHHTSNGCNLRTGDLLGSGTVSGAAEDARGCLLELTRRGAAPVRLASGETRTFLEDGDEVTLRGRCERDGYVGIGLGECVGVIG